MSDQAQTDLSAIDAALAVASGSPEVKPAPTARTTAKPTQSRWSPPPAVRATDSMAGALVDEDDEDEDDDAPSHVGRRVPEKVAKRPAAPVHVPTVPASAAEVVAGSHGFPLIEELAEVKLAVANEARIRAQLAEEKQQVDDSVRAMGLQPGKLRPEFVEKLAAQWLVDGKPLDVIEKFEGHVRHAKRLEAALVLATNALHAAREVGTRRLLPAADEMLRPTAVAMHRKRVELARAIDEHEAAMRRQTAAGFPQGHGFWGVNPLVPTDLVQRAMVFKALVQQGLLNDEEIADLRGIRLAD